METPDRARKERYYDPEAVVRVAGRPDSVLTDGTGHFVLAVEASGDHTVSVNHWKLGLLREATSRPVLLSLGDSTRVVFAVAALTCSMRWRRLSSAPGSRPAARNR